MTRAKAVAQPPSPGTVAVRDLAVLAVIRPPRRDGWLIFLSDRHAWYGTAGAADALPVGEENGGIPAGLS